jgi:hypothetical protein
MNADTTGGGSQMRNAVLATVLILAVTSAWAVKPGFITDMEKAKAECKATGKLIFVFGHMDG